VIRVMCLIFLWTLGMIGLLYAQNFPEGVPLAEKGASGSQSELYRPLAFKVDKANTNGQSFLRLLPVEEQGLFLQNRDQLYQGDYTYEDYKLLETSVYVFIGICFVVSTVLILYVVL